jgi:hypothetical protein
VRTFFASTVALIEPATSAKRVSDVLRDLESGFLVAGQRQVWLERGRAEWVASVRALGRTDACIGDDNVSMYVTLLRQLAGSLKEESFRVEFVTPTPVSADVFLGTPSASEALLNSAREFLSRRGVSMYERWRMQLEALVGFNGAPESEDELSADPFATAYGTETDALALPRFGIRRLSTSSTGEEDDDDEDDNDDTYFPMIDVERSTVDELCEEVKRLRSRVDNAERALNCGICLVSKRDAVIFPCMHAMYCHECVQKHFKTCSSQNAKKCPCCRTVMTGMMRMFV